MHTCNFDCDCPVDNVFEEGFRAGLEASAKLEVYDNGWNRAVEALCNRIEELDTDMFTPKQISEYLYDVFFKQEE